MGRRFRVPAQSVGYPLESMSDDERTLALARKLVALTPGQLSALEAAVDAYRTPATITVNPSSDLANLDFGNFMANILQAHHAVSNEGFTKDKFEHAMLNAMTAQQRPAELATRGNRGHDITVAGERWSLKTEGAANIRDDLLHISKFMELGGGSWTDREEDLHGLRDRMLHHMTGYDRIFVMRHLTGNRRFRGTGARIYELVEIPMGLLWMARDGVFAMQQSSRQFPKPGTCTVHDPETGEVLFDLYFDAGGERKLQVRHIRKDRCVVHATWAWTTE
jgi:hypothetical protein